MVHGSVTGKFQSSGCVKFLSLSLVSRYLVPLSLDIFGLLGSSLSRYQRRECHAVELFIQPRNALRLVESLGPLPSAQASTLDAILCHMIHSMQPYSFSRRSISTQAFYLQTIFQEVSAFEVHRISHLSISPIHAACPVSLIVFNLSSRITLFKTTNSEALSFVIALYDYYGTHFTFSLIYVLDRHHVSSAGSSSIIW